MFQGTGFGGSTSSPFGSSAYKPATSVFNSGPMFGSTGSSSLFGSNTTQPSTGLFGSTTTPTFGQTPQPQNTFGGFTATSNAGQNLFGSQQNANTGSMFGATTTPFGQNKPAFGGFGTTNQTTGLFGQQVAPTQQNQPLFGQPPAQQSTGLFGASTAFGGAATGGTTIKFTPVTGTDTMVKNGVSNQISTRHHCITCMKEYESKSLEELRLEDYAANRKGPQQGGQTGSLFGAPGQQSSLFGTQSSTASTGLFGTTTDNKSVFGSTSAGFGASNTNLFGGNVGSMFNKPAGTAIPFGSTPTSSTATTNFGFNSNTSNNLFGQTTQPGFFSNTSQPSTAFGTQGSGFTPFGQTQQGGLFNQNKQAFNLTTNTNQGGFSFGSTAPSSSTLTSSFTANKTTPFSTFGTPASTAAGFGQTPFGQTQNPSTSFFSNNSFNKPTTGGFSFGNTTTTNTLGSGLNFNSGNSLFGQQQNKPGGLFNSGSSNLFNMNNSFGGSTFNTGASALGSSTFSLGSNQASNSLLSSFGQNTATPQNNPLNQYMLVLASMPFGDSPLFKNLVPSTTKSDEGIKPTSPAAMKSIQSGVNHKVLPNSRSKVKIVKPNSMTRNSLFDGLDDDEEELNGSITGIDNSGIKNYRVNVRRLYLKPRPFNHDSSLSQSINENNNNSNDAGFSSSNMTSPQPQDNVFPRLIKKNLLFQPEQLNDSDINRTSDRITVSPLAKMNDSTMNHSKMLELSNASIDSSIIEDPLRHRADNNLKRLELSKMHISNSSHHSKNKEPAEQSTSTSSSGESEAEECGGQSEEPHSTGIVLTRSGYYTIPSLSDLAQLMDSEGRCIVDNFTIGRLNYGNVFYPESFDVANLNLDKIVHFRHKEVVIYPDDEDKPPVGSGINRRAQVTLDCVWPLDKQTRQAITDPDRLQAMDFEDKLRRASAKHGTRFIEYRPQTGSWVFKVDHFSKYALTDSDEEDSAGTATKQTKFPSATLQGKEQLIPQQQQDPAFSAALRESHKFRARKSMIDVQMDVPLDTLSDHLFLEDEDEEMADGPFDLYEVDGILSPTSKLSRQLGTSAHKLQLMKASFFDQDLPMDHIESGDDGFHASRMEVPARMSNIPFGEPFNSSTLSQSLRQTIDDIPKPGYHKQPLFPPEEQYEESEEDVIVDIEAASSRPVLYQLEHGSSKLEHCMTTIFKGGSESYLADESLARGIAFKPSWGPTGILTTVDMDNPLFINTLSLTSIDQKTFQDCIVEQLEGALKCSLISTESGIPIALCPDGVATLSKHLNIARRQPATDQIFLHAFALCEALWGQLPAEEYEDGSYNISLGRKHAVSSWLETVTAPLAKADLDIKEDSPASVFLLMTSHSIMDACKLAISIGDKRLSLVLSQAGSGRVVRGLVDRQLIEWRETQADRFISPDRIKLYMLAAGKLTHQTSETLVSACQSLDWIRAFALHLWYVCWTTSSISEALNEYDASWSGENSYGPAPLPSHIDTAEDYNDTPLSLLYHMLKLFSDRSHPLDLLLNPETHSSDPLDYRLSWLLMRVFLSLGYSHLSEYNTCLIHSSFASQLELYGLWHWAVFVLLHIDTEQREKLICDTIERHIIHEKDDTKEMFLREKLKIPVAWIASAKATRAIVNKSYEEAARNLLLAGDWNYAHEIIMKHIASSAMMNEKYEFMEQLLDELEKEERFREILSWDTGGLVFLEYLKGVKLIESIRQNGQIDEVFEDLSAMSQRLYSRIKLLPNSTPMDRLCQSTLCERLVTLLPEMPLDAGFICDVQLNDKVNQWQPWDMVSLNTTSS